MPVPGGFPLEHYVLLGKEPAGSWKPALFGDKAQGGSVTSNSHGKFEDPLTDPLPINSIPASFTPRVGAAFDPSQAAFPLISLPCSTHRPGLLAILRPGPQ